MPLTSKGEEIKKKMAEEYGTKKGAQVFYASANKGAIKNVHEALERFGRKMVERHGKK